MNNLKQIKSEQSKVSDIYEITSALQVIASTQSRQFSKRKKDYEPIYKQVLRLTSYFQSLGKLPMRISSKKVHLIFSSDQKFCKNFLNSLENVCRQRKFDKNDTIMLFGSRSYKILESIAQGVEIIQYKALNSFEECESISLILKNLEYPNTFLYAYDLHAGHAKCTEILPTPAIPNSEFENHYTDEVPDLEILMHMYMSSQIYMHMLESGLKERIDRAISMSEASSNADRQAKALKRQYNTTRQAIITKEITSSS